MKGIRPAALCLAAVLCVQPLFGGATYYPDRQSAYTGENTIEIEAEDFSFDGGFKKTADSAASGGYMLQTTEKDAVARYDINIEKPGQNMVCYVYHKAPGKSSNLTYLSFENQDGHSVYARETGKMQTERIYFGTVYGKYSIYLRGARTGHMLDKIVIKYDSIPQTAADGSVTYIEGKPELENAGIAEIPELTEGSYFFEAESGTFGHKSSQIGKDDAASGGAYWYADNGTLTDPYSTEAIGTRCKFKVTNANVYRIWVRYQTPNANRKSTWFGIDNQNYQRLDDGNVAGWKWGSMGTQPLGEGWHTLDIKYRQAQQKIDCVVITSQLSFTPTGLGSVPGMPQNPDESGIKGYETALSKSKIWINGTRGRSDYDFAHYGSDEIGAPAYNYTAMLNLERETDADGYTILMRDRSYIKFDADGKNIIVNGRKAKLSYKLEKAPNGDLLLPVSIVKKAFGIDREFDSVRNCLYMFDFYEDNARDAKDGEIIALDGFIEDINLKIPYSEPNVEIKVWVRCSETDAHAANKQNFDNMYLLSEGGYNYKFTSQWNGFPWSREGWVECPKPYWKDGAFYTRRGELYNKGMYDVKVSVVKNGKPDVFIAKALAPVHEAKFAQTTEEYKVETGGGLALTPTFENIGFYIDYDKGDKAAECRVTYRKKGDSEWKKAYRPMQDEKLCQFRGSIVKLAADTEYEVSASIYDADGAEIKTRSASVKTWSEDVPVAKTYKLSDLYDGSGQLALLDMQGTADGWIKIDCGGEEIRGDKNMLEALYISNCRYLIFENAVITGGREFGANISNGSENIRFINCDVSGWGPGDGVYDDSMGMYYIKGYFPNYCSGINIKGAKNILVERCYVHDADVKTNQWTSTIGASVHPCGSDAMRIAADGGIVIRYNDFIGSDEHRWNDAIEGANNGALRWGCVARDSDIYGNMMIYTQDDILELDGAAMNVRVYENRMEQSLCGISSAPTAMGPAYIFRNLYYNVGTEINEEWGSATKIGGLSPDKYNGLAFLINNTFDSNAHTMRNGNYGGSSEYHSVTRNNISNTHNEELYAFRSYFADYRDSNDYDMFHGVVDLHENNGKDELHAVYAVPEYEDESGGDYRLAEGSRGIDEGENIDNFSEPYVTDGKTDMGAFERGGAMKYLPNRPIDISADKTFFTLTDKKESTLVFRVGNIEEGHTYKIVKNKDYKWLSVLSEQSGKLIPNSEIRVTLRADLDGHGYGDGNGMVLLRLENGYSVPVTVYAEKPSK